MLSRAHKIKLKPNKAQAIQLAKTAGTARYAYNWGLAKWNELYAAGEKCDQYMLSRLWTLERPEWATEVNRGSVTKAFINLGGAYKAFFQRRAAHPIFHRKGYNDSFYVDGAHAKVGGKKIHLPKIGAARMTESLRYADGKIMSYHVSKEAGDWYVSIRVEIPDERRTESTSVVGVDVGCNTIAVASDGTVCETPAKLKHYERQLKRKQRLLARKARGSSNRAKARLVVTKAYQKIRRIKQDAVHKFTATIAKNHGVVCIETLDVKSMKEGENKYVRKGVQNSAMAEVHRQLMYKCNTFVRVDQFFPSSKTCSNCGSIKEDITLSDRAYHCSSCGTTIDRDLNAALNLRQEGCRIITAGHAGSACGETPSGAR